MIVRPYRPQDQGALVTLWYESWRSTGLERPLVTWQALADRIASARPAKQRFPQGFWLSTQPENVRARAFYEHNGLTLDHARTKLDDERVIYVFAGARR